MKALQFGAGLLRSSGGTTRSAVDFELAIKDIKTISVCTEQELKREGPYSTEWIYLPAAGDPLSQRLYRPKHSSVKEALTSIGEVNSVISHLLFRHNSCIAKSFANERNLPYHIVPHGSLDPFVMQTRRMQKSLWMYAFGTRFIREAKHLIFATRREMERAQQVMDVPNGTVINWPVDITERTEFSRKDTRERYGIPKDLRMLISFGRFHSVKRPLELIEAFNRLQVSDLGLLLVGPDGDITLEDCKNKVSAGAKVYCLPGLYGDELRSVVSACDGYISWSIKENFNYTLAESLGLGLPVILSPGNGLCGELKAVQCGWVANDDSFDTLIAILKAFREESEGNLLKFGDSGLHFARDNFSRANFNRAVRELMGYE